jgi:hypothetical protein
MSAWVRRKYESLESRITVCSSMDHAKGIHRVAPYHTAIRGVEYMNDTDTRYCLSMARSLEAEAARMRDNSYPRKLLQELAAKYRADAAGKCPPAEQTLVKLSPYRSVPNKFLKHLGVSMRTIASKRIAYGISKAGIARYLTALSLAIGLLVVWAGICAI